MNQLDRLKQRTTEAYLAHRLNQPELARVVKGLERGDSAAAKADLDRFTPVDCDWRGKLSEGSLEHSLSFLGLDKEFTNLSQDKPWSPSQRAIYRRLSAPQNDPSLAPEGPVAHGNATFVRIASRRFQEWDADNNGRLSPSELDSAMASGRYTCKDAAALVTLRSAGEFLQSRKNGVSLADLKSFREHGLPGQAGRTDRLNQGFPKTVARAESMPAAGALRKESFDAREIYQCKTAACVMLSTSAGVGNVRNMFHDNHDGTVTVTFRDGVKETVKDLTEAERLYHSRCGTQQERWPGLLEMAMGQRRLKEGQSEDGTARGGVNYLPPRKTMTAMTGNPGRAYSLGGRSPNATRTLLENLAGGKHHPPVICCSRNGWGENDKRYTVESLHNGIVNNHAYTIEGYDPKTDLVSLRNPWHSVEWTICPDGEDDGKFQMPLLDFYSSFGWVATAAASV